MPRISFSVRLSEEERAALEKEGGSVSAGIRRAIQILSRLRMLEKEGMSDVPLARALRIAEGLKE